MEKRSEEGAIALARVRAKPGTGDRFVEGSREAVKALRKDGNVGKFIVFRGVEDPDQFVVFMEWASLDAHHAFVESPLLQEYRGPTVNFRDGDPDSSHYRIAFEDDPK